LRKFYEKEQNKKQMSDEKIKERIEKFEDLIAWQKARELTKEVYQISRLGAFAKDFGLAGQMQRASVSIMSNIAEGFERGGRGEFHQFLSVAKASCAEVRSLLYVALDVNYIKKNEFNKIMDRAVEVGRIVGGLRASVDKQRKAHRKSKR
jgi:four helix bundle protein